MAAPRIFDRRLLDRRRRRALAAAVPGAGFLLEAAAVDLVDRLAAVQRSFPIALDLGSPTSFLADALVASGQVERVVRLDRLRETLTGSHLAVAADEEALPFAPASFDLVVSALALQWVNDLPGALAQAKRVLKPDGLFLAAIVGGETLGELRDAFAIAEAETSGGASPRIAPFADVRTLGALLQRAGFALPVTDQDRRTVRYADALGLMRDLRAMGATNVLFDRDRRPLSRAALTRALAVYAERFAGPDGRVTATFDIVSLSGWAPHQSQPQPLKPGTGGTRLADALGTVERDAGEKAGR